MIWRYILATNEPKQDPDEIVLRLFEAVGEEERKEIMTAADMLIERGRKQGRDEGLEQLRAMLLKLLRSRFGMTLPEAAVAQVSAADMAQLDVWFDRGLTAATLADVLATAEPRTSACDSCSACWAASSRSAIASSRSRSRSHVPFPRSPSSVAFGVRSLLTVGSGAVSMRDGRARAKGAAPPTRGTRAGR